MRMAVLVIFRHCLVVIKHNIQNFAIQQGAQLDNVSHCSKKGQFATCLVAQVARVSYYSHVEYANYHLEIQAFVLFPLPHHTRLVIG